MRIIYSILFVLLIALTGCAGLQRTDTPGVIPTAQLATTSLPENSPDGSETGTPAASNQPVTLTLWIPDNFAINSSEQVQKLLDDRLATFVKANPDIKVDLRFKNIGSKDNMMELLNTTSRVAPSILPDIVLLDRKDMEIAALKGLLVPMDAYLMDGIENESLPGFISLGRLQGSLFGLPAAGDVLLLVGNQDNKLPISSWQDISNLGMNVGTNFSDPDSITSISLYLSAGGRLIDASGKPHIDPEALIQLINMIRITRVYSVFPEWSVLSTDRNEVTRHFMDGDTDLEINWYSSIPDSNIDQYSYRPVPGLTEKSASTLTGWYWSVANPAPERQAASKQLLTFLYQPIFASTWSDTAGYLPVTSQHWPQTDVRFQSLQSILNSAEPLPDQSIMITLGPVIRDAVIRAYSTNDAVEEITASAIARINQE